MGKKEKKVWMIYALYADTGEILAAFWGKRNRAGVRRLMMRVKKVDIETFCKNYWEAFREVLPARSHIVGKEHKKR